MSDKTKFRLIYKVQGEVEIPVGNSKMSQEIMKTDDREKRLLLAAAKLKKVTKKDKLSGLDYDGLEIDEIEIIEG